MHGCQNLAHLQDCGKYYVVFNPFIPTDRFANSVDSDETTRSEPAHQDLHCLTIFY